MLLKPSKQVDMKSMHSKGMRPSHDIVNPDDPLLFTYHYSHHDIETDRLIHYQYHAQRQPHVRLMEAPRDVTACLVNPLDGTNVTVIELTMPSKALERSNITVGTELACVECGPTPLCPLVPSSQTCYPPLAVSLQIQ